MGLRGHGRDMQQRLVQDEGVTILTQKFYFEQETPCLNFATVEGIRQRICGVRVFGCLMARVSGRVCARGP